MQTPAGMGTSISDTLVPRLPRSSGFQPVAPHRKLLAGSASSSARQGVVVLSELLLGQWLCDRRGTVRDDERWCSARDEYTHDDDHPGWF